MATILTKSMISAGSTAITDTIRLTLTSLARLSCEGGKERKPKHDSYNKGFEQNIFKFIRTLIETCSSSKKVRQTNASVCANDGEILSCLREGHSNNLCLNHNIVLILTDDSLSMQLLSMSFLHNVLWKNGKRLRR